MNHSAVLSGSVGRASEAVGGTSFGSAGNVSVVGSASDEVHRVCKRLLLAHILRVIILDLPGCLLGAAL